jgi:pimeloyl-ACP methyl ester carboxylesterase
MNEAVHSNQREIRPARRLILLPGMDGMGELFSDFLKALPEWIAPAVVRYPAHTCLSYEELLPIVRSALPASDPFFVLAESFSTPLAVELAADPPANMQGLVIIAGFITPPIGGIQRWFLAAMAPLLFRMPLPAFWIRRLLLGPDAPPHLVGGVHLAIESVSPAVLSHRLRAILACDETRRSARVSIPVLYIRPDKDRLVSHKAFRDFCYAIPGAAVETIAGPHLILQREPRAAADVMVAFVDRILRFRATSS